MQITICLLVFLFMVVSFSMNKIPMALTSMIGMLVLVISGCVVPKPPWATSAATPLSP